jgi:hypothetical protein
MDYVKEMVVGQRRWHESQRYNGGDAAPGVDEFGVSQSWG